MAQAFPHENGCTCVLGWLYKVLAQIIPEAICSRYGLAVGANFGRACPYSDDNLLSNREGDPMQKEKSFCSILDFLLGQNESALFRWRAQLKALISIHSKEVGKGGELTHDEATIISGALHSTEKLGRPLEEDLASGGHHSSSTTVPDLILQASAGEEVTFVFANQVGGKLVPVEPMERKSPVPETILMTPPNPSSALSSHKGCALSHLVEDSSICT
ncbi:uncharacterized protein LOC116250327 [Nymphaea colorata]|nr:uncharacterized protein LOC116250327 [Nymphaea colorata]